MSYLNAHKKKTFREVIRESKLAHFISNFIYQKAMKELRSLMIFINIKNGIALCVVIKILFLFTC